MIINIIVHNLSKLGDGIFMKLFDFDTIDMSTLANHDAVLVGTDTWDNGELP